MSSPDGQSWRHGGTTGPQIGLLKRGHRSVAGFTPCFPLLLQPPSSVDLTRINLQSSVAVNYWCQAFNCTETRLRNAVLAVGLLPPDVQAYLSR